MLNILAKEIGKQRVERQAFSGFPEWVGILKKYCIIVMFM
jgi:hypothetical protein